MEFGKVSTSIVLNITIIRPVTFLTVQKSTESSRTTATNTPMKDDENMPPNRYTSKAADRNAT